MNRLNHKSLLYQTKKEHSTRSGCSKIKTKSKFIQIIIKVLNTALMCSQQPSLKQGGHNITFGKKVFSNSPFLFSNLMSIARSFQLTVSLPAICHYFTTWVNAFLYRMIQTISRSIRYTFKPYTTDTRTINLCCNYNQKLTFGTSSTFTCSFASNISLVNLNYSRNTVTTGTKHCMSNPVHPFPSRMITTYAQGSLKPQCTNTMFLVCYIPHCLKPQLQRFPSILKYCSCGYRSPEIAIFTFIQLVIYNPCLFMFTTGTLESIRPSNAKKIFTTCLFRIKSFLKFYDIFRVFSHTHIYYILGLGQSSA